jgi:hypothetical protein
VRGIGVLLLLIGLALMAYGAAPLVRDHGTAWHWPFHRCDWVVADEWQGVLSFSESGTRVYALDVKINGSRIVGVDVVEYSTTVSMAAGAGSGLRVVVRMMGFKVYDGGASLGPDGLYHAIVSVPEEYAAQPLGVFVQVTLYTCGG